MVCILLGTYNGERWLDPLLASIQRQTLADWRLLVRDDGSQDGTWDVLRRHTAANSRIELFRGENLGPAGNFGRLMALAAEREATHAFFADQDDVWRDDKLQRQLAALRDEERRHGDKTPILVHSDLELVDEQLRTKAASLFAHERRPSDVAELAPLLVRNCVTGCATAINKALLELASPLPACSPMHDWWLALCAAAAGRIRFLPETLVKYRQHGGNQVGARRRLAALLPLGKSARLRRIKAVRNFAGAVAQAVALRERLAARRIPVAETVASQLDRFCGLFTQPISARRQFAELCQLGAMRPGLLGRMQVRYCLKELKRWEQRDIAAVVGGSDLRLQTQSHQPSARKRGLASSPAES